uniref:Nitric oxide synthase trafficking n=1 Tax=Salarias fasciatus TaxID=181472 RepID=A0A672IZE5_SALFA
MKNPVSTCSYQRLYQNVKKYSKNGEFFCKELLAVFQQRAELELTYAKGLQKLAGRLINASKGMSNNSTYSAWCQVSDEMYSRADAHRSLGNAFQQEAILEIRQVLDEHSKRKRPLDSAVERTGKLVTANWNEQLKIKKKLVGLTREHEALFNFVESNKQMCTEKEKQKMLNRLSKSAEMQTRVDEEYFNINLEGHQIRLKWENTLKHCYQVLQEMEKQRIEVLFNSMSRYSLYMSGFGQTLKHGQSQIQQAAQRVDMDKDIQTLVEVNSITAADNKSEFLMADYFEEDSKSFMGKDRRREAIKLKLQRLEDSITKTRKDREGLQKLAKMYSENPSFSNQNNLEDTEQQLDEVKDSRSLKELKRFLCNKDIFPPKDCVHSVVQLSRPVKLRRAPLRSRHSLRASIIYKGPSPFGSQLPAERPLSAFGQITSTAEVAECDGTVDGTDAGRGQQGDLFTTSTQGSDAMVSFTGDLLNIYSKEENGWWYGALNGQCGLFPSTYVEELPVFGAVTSSDA